MNDEALRSEIARLTSALQTVTEERDRYKQSGDEGIEYWRQAHIKAKAHVSELTAAIQQAIALPRLHELTGPISECGCAACNVHNKHLAALQQANRHDEEFVPHPFNVRIMVEEGEEIRDGIWCKDCEYHRDHEIHTSPKLQQAHQWQPIETAPKDGTVVVGALIRGRVRRVSDMAFNRIGWYTQTGDGCHWVTHWTPLPPLPDLGERKT